MADDQDKLRPIRDEISNYEDTVNALLSFAAILLYDGDERRSEAEFGLGRRMAPVSGNEITPDLVGQKSTSYGIAAEIKKSLSRVTSSWDSHLHRLRKYSDPLKGWWTKDESIPGADGVILIHQSRARDFTQYLREALERDATVVSPNSAVIEFNRSDEATTYYFFRTEHGVIADPELAGRLQSGIPVPLDEARGSFPSIQYYDAKPPLVLLMTHLWMDLFPAFLEGAERDEGTGAFHFQVSAEAATRELQSAYGSSALRQDDRSCEFPRVSWVREAFEEFVHLKLATPPPDASDTYTVYYRVFRNDVQEHLAKMVIARSPKGVPPPDKHQINLFQAE